MFGIFKTSPEKNLQKMQQAYEKKLADAMHAQRNGDIRKYSLLTEEAQELHRKIESAKL